MRIKRDFYALTVLIQTIGRAARNSEGRVILYADKVTKSMEEAMRTTAERRQKQIEFNLANGISPQTIQKSIQGGVIELLRKDKKRGKGVASFINDYKDLSSEDLELKIKELGAKMKEASKNLDFELAAKYRDEIKELNSVRLII